MPIYRGHVNALGVLAISISAKSLADKDVDIIVRLPRRQRSLDQNAYLHGVPFPILADYFGYSIPEVKLALLGECFGYRLDKISRRELPVKPSTSGMTVEECSHFIDWLIPWAIMEHGVTIPLPNEVLYEDER